MFQLLSVAEMHEEKVRILRSLGEVKNKELIQRVLDLSMSVSCGFHVSQRFVQALIYWRVDLALILSCTDF